MQLATDLLNIDTVIRLLMYGRTGSGKTTLAAMMAQHPQFRPVEFMDFDLRLYSIVKTLPVEALEHISFTSYIDKHPGEAFERADARLSQLARAKPEERPRTLVLDSLTFFGNSVLAQAVDLDPGDNKKNPLYRGIAVREHYGPQMQHVERFIQKLRSLPINIVVTAHEDPEKDNEGNILHIGPDTTGKLANRLPGYFNEYWHVTVFGTSFMVQTVSSGLYEARTCFNLNPAEKQSEIWNKIVGQVEERAKKGGEKGEAKTLADTIKKDGGVGRIPPAMPEVKTPGLTWKGEEKKDV